MPDFRLYDFDTEFSKYLQQWYEQNFGRFRTYDEMEDCVPDVYQEFLDTPADFLNGEKPGMFFERYDDPQLLTDWLTEYVRQDINVPDMLLNRIADLGSASVAPLLRLLQDASQPSELRMHVISLLREIGSSAPYPVYIQWIASWDGQDELTENAIDTLESEESLSADHIHTIKNAYDQATSHGKTAFLSILSRGKGNGDMVSKAIRLFEQEPDLRIHLAPILARFGRSSALPVLKQAALSQKTGYLLYIELRSAIEALGGSAPKRSFAEGDPEYDSLRLLQDRD